jgi:hypothetical protein
MAGTGKTPDGTPRSGEEGFGGMKNRGDIKGVIKHRQTAEYYAGDGQWTGDQEQAMVFHNLSSLVDEALRHNIRDCCEFILRYEEQPGVNVYLPL